jgi:hypothetical protein
VRRKDRFSNRPSDPSEKQKRMMSLLSALHTSPLAAEAGSEVRIDMEIQATLSGDEICIGSTFSLKGSRLIRAKSDAKQVVEIVQEIRISSI